MNTNDNEMFKHLIKGRSGTMYTLEWEEKHPSSFRISFVGNNYFFYDEEDTRDPAITRVSNILVNEGFILVMDHSVKEPNTLISYSLRFKKESGEDTKCFDMMKVVKALTANG